MNNSKNYRGYSYTEDACGNFTTNSGTEIDEMVFGNLEKLMKSVDEFEDQ